MVNSKNEESSYEATLERPFLSIPPSSAQYPSLRYDFHAS